VEVEAAGGVVSLVDVMARESRKAREERLAREVFKQRVAGLIGRIDAAGLRRAVRARYDSSQGNADTTEPEGSEAYEWAQHDHAIEQVFNFLAERGLVAEGDDEEVVCEAFSNIS
jgi:predicted deacylase